MTDSLKPPYTFDKLRLAKTKEVIDEINHEFIYLKRQP